MSTSQHNMQEICIHKLTKGNHSAKEKKKKKREGNLDPKKKKKKLNGVTSQHNK